MLLGHSIYDNNKGKISILLGWSLSNPLWTPLHWLKFRRNYISIFNFHSNLGKFKYVNFLTSRFQIMKLLTRIIV